MSTVCAEPRCEANFLWRRLTLPPDEYDQLFIHATHSSLHVGNAPGSAQPTPDIVPVTVLNASDGTKVPFMLKSIDTIGKLQRRYERLNPELVGRLNLAYNGKPVSVKKTLGELGVKPGDTFITYQKCTGG